MDTGQRITYHAVLIGGFALLVLPPFLVRVVRRQGWPATEPEPGLEEAT